MIIGGEVCRIVEGMTIELNNNSISVQNNLGKQDALDKFISECDRLNAKKFPLIFYVTSKVQDDGLKLKCDTNIVIMTNTDMTWLSKKRKSETFDKIINPIYEKLIESINYSKYLSIVNLRDQLFYEDIANYGIVKGEIGQKKSSKSVASDFIDARKINLTLEYFKNT